VYRGRLGPAWLGFGVEGLHTRGKTTTQVLAAPASSTAAATIAGTTDVTTTFSGVAPQMSFNFGRRDGWSYISGGYGVSTLTSEVITDKPGPAAGRLTQRNQGNWSGTVNFGAGARWFTGDRLAFAFDARFHRVGSSGLRPSTQLFGLSVGVSMR
jgi:hypothetical protein